MILTNDGKEILAIYRQDGTEIEEVKDANGRIVYSALREITGTLPLSLYSLGKPLTDYLISGNTVQDGTPTPEAPVDVVGCGVRTGNLFDVSTVEKGRIDNGTVGYASNTTDMTVSDGVVRFTTDANYRGVCFGFIEIPSGVDSLSFSGTFRGDNGIGKKFVFYDAQKAWMNADYAFSIAVNSGTVAIPSGAKYVRLSITAQVTGATTISNIMINAGTTALPYIPYGYKLPLTVNGTEYPIYLGQVPTTRRIKKLVLTGEERWDVNSTAAAPNSLAYTVVSDALTGIAPFCTHYEGTDKNTWASIPLNNVTVSIVSGSWTRCAVNIGGATLADFKSYLAAQYANGTPVTVWYVLAEPETGIVNEPLHKIGDYADTISFTQAGVTIPTLSGANVIDMASTVKPSEMYIKGNGIKPI